MKKILLLAIIALFTSTAMQAQIGESKSKKIVNKAVKAPAKFTNELGLYIQDGWGIGYQLRREFNQYVGWNIIGVSYMSGFVSPAEVGQFNFKLLGARGYTPAWKSIRGYVDLNLGYTLYYYERYDVEAVHNFGLDFGLGVQVHKNVAVGYNLNVLAGGFDEAAKSHWFKVSFLF
ncbi:MAG: hypothetical protein IJ020_06875 [Bacteroidaceae bacterium]|nr:hypothetical protein [Bacteroidaceae bacterium]